MGVPSLHEILDEKIIFFSILKGIPKRSARMFKSGLKLLVIRWRDRRAAAN